MKTKGMGIALLSAAALLGSAVAQAELPWTYAEFGYSKADGDDFFERRRLRPQGQHRLPREVARLSCSTPTARADSDIFGGSDDFDGYRVIVGAHPQLTPNTQLVTDLPTPTTSTTTAVEGATASASASACVTPSPTSSR